MSENEDFFLDEDFLNDLDQTSQLYYSQLENTDDDDDVSSNKRRKLHHSNIDERDIGSKFCRKKPVDKPPELSSRKNLILNIFESNCTMKTSTPSTSNELSSATESTLSNSVIDKNPEHHYNSKKLMERIPPPSSSARKLALKIIEKKSKESERNKTELPSGNSILPRTTSSSLDVTQFKKNDSQPLIAISDNNKYSSDLFKTCPVQPKTLVRKFPGPAGLIPDGLKETLKNSFKDTLKENLVDDAIYYLQNLDENEMNGSKSSDTSCISEFCSQDTKKLFSDGAWRRMLDDLPKNFLRGHDIASLKRPGRPNKVPLLAAVIHRIEHNAENPRIILKDISNSIEAIMHKDIPTKYPNILQSGVVVLLRDIGILNFQGAQKYSTISLVMIPPNSILGVYSDKERLVTTPALNEILKRDYDVELTNTINNTSNYNIEVVKEYSSKPKREKYKSCFEKKINREMVHRDLENINPIENFDDISDLDFDEEFADLQRNDIKNIITSSSNDNNKIIVTKAIIEAQPNNSLINNDSPSSTLPIITDNDPTITINASGDTTILPSTGFTDDLFNDTDDEILSQFDVDSIANNQETLQDPHQTFMK